MSTPSCWLTRGAPEVTSRRRLPTRYELQLLATGPDRPARVADPDRDRGSLDQVRRVIQHDRTILDSSDARFHDSILTRERGDASREDLVLSGPGLGRRPRPPCLACPRARSWRLAGSGTRTPARGEGTHARPNRPVLVLRLPLCMCRRAATARRRGRSRLRAGRRRLAGRAGDEPGRSGVPAHRGRRWPALLQPGRRPARPLRRRRRGAGHRRRRGGRSAPPHGLRLPAGAEDHRLGAGARAGAGRAGQPRAGRLRARPAGPRRRVPAPGRAAPRRTAGVVGQRAPRPGAGLDDRRRAGG